MSICFLGNVNSNTFLYNLGFIENKVILFKEMSLEKEDQSDGFCALDSAIKEINEVGNVHLNYEKVKHNYFTNSEKLNYIYFINLRGETIYNYENSIKTDYENLIKTVRPFISDNIQDALTCDALLEKIATVKCKIDLFVFHAGSPFSKGLPVEILTRILMDVPMNKAASICKNWNYCSAGVWTRSWGAILNASDAPAEMKEGMQALKRLSPRDSGFALIAEFFDYYGFKSKADLKKELNRFSRLSVQDLKEKMIACFQARKDHSLMILWNHMDCPELKSMSNPTTAQQVREIMQNRENQEKLKGIKKLDLSYSGLCLPPEELRLFSGLESLDLRGNEILHFKVPEECIGLEKLHLGLNNLTDLYIPEKFEKLKELFLYCNKLAHLTELFRKRFHENLWI